MSTVVHLNLKYEYKHFYFRIWQHCACMLIEKNNEPEKYECELCQPRTVDRERARSLQLLSRKAGQYAPDILTDEDRLQLLSWKAGQHAPDILTNEENRPLCVFGVPFSSKVPFAKPWTSDQVFAYFSQFFHLKVAKVFKEHNIDGKTLFLLQREDVLNRLKFKLGTAVKIYSHVLRLQTRSNEFRKGNL